MHFFAVHNKLVYDGIKGKYQKKTEFLGHSRNISSYLHQLSKGIVAT